MFEKAGRDQPPLNQGLSGPKENDPSPIVQVCLMRTIPSEPGKAYRLDGGREVVLQPVRVRDDVLHGEAVDLGVHEVGDLSGGVVTPDGHVGDRVVPDAGL